MLENKRKCHYRQQLFLILMLVVHYSKALQCRSEDGPSEADLKRVIRSCMRKFGESMHGSGNNGGSGGADPGFQSTSNTNYHYGQNGRHNNNNNNNYGQQSNSKMDYGYDSDENDGSDENDYNGGNMGRRNIFQQRNRERNSILNNRNNGNPNGNGSSNGSGRSSSSNNNNNSNHNNNPNNNGNNPRNFNTKSYNNYNGGRGGSSHDSGSSNAGNSHSFYNQNGDNNQRNGNGTSSYDTNCIVHCFFDEMNMLNRDDYPDKHKVHYLLTKDMRDRELRSFYADTIQSCFRYLETQRRRDKCQFSRDLIQCMSEYAQANCDDWQEFNVMFN